MRIRNTGLLVVPKSNNSNLQALFRRILSMLLFLITDTPHTHILNISKGIRVGYVLDMDTLT